MSRKPSMFSKDYRRKLRRRRMKYMVILVFLIIAIGLGGVLISSDNEFAYIRRLFSNSDSKKEVDSSVESVNGELNEKQNEIIEDESKVSTFNATLQSGKKVAITYEEVDGKRKFNNIDSELEIECRVSPSREVVLIFDKVPQDMYLVNTNEEIVNITNPQYIATTNEIFKKEDVLKHCPSYKWIESAQFIDDINIAYTSGLPWINDSGDRYLWIFNSESGKHTGYFNIKGKEIILGEVTNKGVTTTKDGNQFTVNTKGEIVK